MFGEDHVHYLGHIINAKGASVDTEKMQAIYEWLVPSSPLGFRGFLGVAGFTATSFKVMEL